MNVLVVKPQEYPVSVQIDGTLKSMQELVGGLIQAIYPFEEPVALIANDEGKLLGLPLNRALRHPKTGEIYDVIVGTFFLCAAPPDRGEFEGLTEEQIRRYTQRFQHLEFFF